MAGSQINRAMRVLLVHNRYQEIGGEDMVFKAEKLLLREHGKVAEVATLLFDNDQIPSRRTPMMSARLAASTVWSRDACERLQSALRSTMPDIVHFHNTFPLVSPAAYATCRAEGVAVVQTLHNYRLVCPNALLFRNGQPCEDCVGHTPPWQGIVHACYRDSRAQTGAVAAMLTVHRLRRTWQRDVDRYIALTEFSRQKFIQGGLPPERIVVKPNFLEPDPGAKDSLGDGFLFVGRLVGYKGVETLLRAWAKPSVSAPLMIAGDGPLTGAVEQSRAENPSIVYLGPVPRTVVLKQMHQSRALIFPSILYENFPVTIVEAFACGLPVIASRIGAMPELVDEGRTGILFNHGDAEDLAAKVRWAQAHPEAMARMSIEARREYEARYTAERNCQVLMDIYASAIGQAEALGQLRNHRLAQAAG